MKRTWHVIGVAAAMMLLACSGAVDEPSDPAGVAPAAADSRLESAPPPASASAPAEVEAGIETATPEVEKTTTTRTVTETKRIAFKTRTVTDSTLAKGVRKTRVKGVAGVRTLTYELTFVDGKQTVKKLVSQAVTEKPVTKVVVVGTKSAETGGGDCDPNYSGACVPVASDVDCAGGSGNGPEYVRGPVEVVGDDIYDLDRDGDGTACD